MYAPYSYASCFLINIFIEYDMRTCSNITYHLCAFLSLLVSHASTGCFAILVTFALLVNPFSSYAANKDGESGPAASPESPAYEQGERFQDMGDGTVIDHSTGIMWTRSANIFKMPLTWQSAKQYIYKMNIGEVPNFGHSNWRLPSIQEIETLIDKTSFYPAIPKSSPFENVLPAFYWSATVQTGILQQVWFMDMSSGTTALDMASYCTYKHIWPVRGDWKVEQESTGFVLSSGMNNHGQLGDGSFEDKVSFVTVKNLSNIVGVSLGVEHSLAVHADGSVWAWGRNSNGQLGIGSNNDSNVPVIVKNLWKVVDISAGQSHSLALKEDGTVWAWGKNSYGQLGNGTLKDSLGPVQVANADKIVAISAGMHHSLALKDDGTVWAWGRNSYGQLGDGTTVNRNIAVKALRVKGARGISAGLHHSVSNLKDGTIAVWGWNRNGLLGDGTSRDRHRPIRLKKITDVVSISAGLYHTIALKSNGSVLAWGMNDYGQLGTSSSVRSSLPVVVEGLDDVTVIDAKMYHSVGLTKDGSVWVWGKVIMNAATKSLPVKIRDVSNVVDVAAGKYFTVVLKKGD
jgi:alpha-tubulin suppressor-like RCC1 family protein